MKIRFVEVSDAPIIHELMMRAFMEYENEIPPSSALDETVQSISTAIESGEQALVGYLNGEAVGMVRFQLNENSIYFYRLSVIPEKQGQGLAKEILLALESYAVQKEKSTILCKVRMTVTKNIKLYSSMGYSICGNEVVHKPDGITINVVSMGKQLN